MPQWSAIKDPFIKVEAVAIEYHLTYSTLNIDYAANEYGTVTKALIKDAFAVDYTPFAHKIRLAYAIGPLVNPPAYKIFDAIGEILDIEDFETKIAAWSATDVGNAGNAGNEGNEGNNDNANNNNNDNSNNEGGIDLTKDEVTDYNGVTWIRKDKFKEQKTITAIFGVLFGVSTAAAITAGVFLFLAKRKIAVSNVAEP